MGYTTLTLDVTPNATAYDANYPTRSTELLNHQLHEMIEDMDLAAGVWYLSDNSFTSSEWITLRNSLYNNIKEVFDYADLAITNYRATGSPGLSLPLAADIALPSYTNVYPHFQPALLRHYHDCMAMKFKIYYMWMTEEDPLLLKEKLQELLIAWPLMDTTIDLQTESGQTIRMYPSWKNVDLDL
jgi:hypothetical protein